MIYPHVDGQINGSLLGELVRANKGRRGFTYTHHKLDVGLNTWYIATANQLGFTVNVSTESKDDAVTAFNKGLPAVVVVPSDHADSAEHDGVKFMTCPAQTRDITCAECGLCSQSQRQCVVMFKAHGNAKRHVSELVK